MSNATDPKTLTQLNAELLQSIAETIVEPEVMKPMERIGWSHADPTLSPEPDNPVVETPTAEATPKPDAPKVDNPPAATADAPPAPAVTDSIDWESLRDTNGLIIGKYKTAAEALKGAGHIVGMAKQAFSRVNEVERENAELKIKLVTPVAFPASQTLPTVPSPEVMDNMELEEVLKEIIDEGGTLDEKNAIKLRSAINSGARSVALKAVEEALAAKDAKATKENQKWIAVDAYMREKHPQSVQFTDEMALYVESDPLTKNAVASLINSGNEKMAAELAWERYQSARNMEVTAATNVADQRKEITLDAADQVRKEAVDAARKDAGVMTTMASGTHETPNLGPSQEEIDSAGAEMLRTGLGERWRALTIGKDLHGPLFD